MPKKTLSFEINIGSGNGLVPDITKPLSNPVLIYTNTKLSFQL